MNIANDGLNCMALDWSTVLNHWSAHWASGMWRACWQGTLLIALIWATCRLLPRLPVSIRYWLWWLACLKLLVGLLWATPIALPLLPTADGLHNSIGVLRTPDGAAHTSILDSPIVPSPQATHTPLAPLSLASFLMLAWGTGVMLWIGIMARQFLSLRRLVAQAQVVTEISMEEQIAWLKQRLHLHRQVPILTSPDVTSLLVIGPVRPVVLIPENISQQLSPSELEMALAHEFVHVKRGDLWWAQIPALAQILFFFHPLVWLAQREWAISCEAACDAETLRLTAASPAEYGQILLKLVTSVRAPSVSVALGATRDFRMIESRLRGLHHLTPLSRRQIRLSLALLAAVSCIGIIPWRVTARSEEGHKSLPVPSYHAASSGADFHQPNVTQKPRDSGTNVAIRHPRSNSPSDGAGATREVALGNARRTPGTSSRPLKSPYRLAQATPDRASDEELLPRAGRPQVLPTAPGHRKISSERRANEPNQGQRGNSDTPPLLARPEVAPKPDIRPEAPKEPRSQDDVPSPVSSENTNPSVPDADNREDGRTYATSPPPSPREVEVHYSTPTPPTYGSPRASYSSVAEATPRADSYESAPSASYAPAASSYSTTPEAAPRTYGYAPTAPEHSEAYR